MKLKFIAKIAAAVIIIVPAIGYMTYYTMNAENIPFETVCVDGNSKFNEDLCANVGKRAHSIKNMLGINDTDYGKIVGVAWRQRGSIISSQGQEMRYSASNSYYYIISGDKKGYYFLRIVSETEAR